MHSRAHARQPPDLELDDRIAVPQLEYSSEDAVMSILNGFLISLHTADEYRAKALMVMRNAARAVPSLAFKHASSWLPIVDGSLTRTSPKLVRGCAASFYAALSSGVAGREWMFKRGLAKSLLSTLKELMQHPEDGHDVQQLVVALANLALFPAARAEMLAAGAVPLLVEVLKCGLSMLLLGTQVKSTVGCDTLPPMKRLCTSALNFLVNAASEESARDEMLAGDLHHVLEQSLALVEKQGTQHHVLLSRAKLLTGMLGIQHLYANMSKFMAKLDAEEAARGHHGHGHGHRWGSVSKATILAVNRRYGAEDSPTTSHAPGDRSMPASPSAHNSPHMSSAPSPIPHHHPNHHHDHEHAGPGPHAPSVHGGGEADGQLPGDEAEGQGESSQHHRRRRHRHHHHKHKHKHGEGTSQGGAEGDAGPEAQPPQPPTDSQQPQQQQAGQSGDGAEGGGRSHRHRHRHHHRHRRDESDSTEAPGHSGGQTSKANRQGKHDGPQQVQALAVKVASLDL